MFRRRFELLPALDPPFRPDQKVKLDKRRGQERGPFLQAARHDQRYATSGIAATLARNARMGHPRFVMGKEKQSMGKGGLTPGL